MSEWAAKRFWKDAEVAPVESGFTVLLDGRSVKTPAKSSLIVPTESLAHEIAAEWAAQDEKVNPLLMPFTRSANAALDKVRPQKQEVCDMLAAYGDADLLCYRADAPRGLVDRQSSAWDPLLDWAAERYGARLHPRVGVMHESQALDALASLSEQLNMFSSFELAGLHDLVGLSGSLVLALAVAEEVRSPQEAWEISRIDESWQEEQWGKDEDATAVAVKKYAEFVHAERFLRKSRV